MVFIHEDLNKNIVEVQKNTMSVIFGKDICKQYEFLENAKNIMKIQIWTDMRFLMINKAITPGEITEFIRRQLDIDKDIQKWMAGIKCAISAKE